MPFISRNAQLGRPLKLSSWRKIAIGTWSTAGDPSVYGFLDVDAQPALDYIEKVRQRTGNRTTITHFMGKAIAETLSRHPDINCILRFGRLYPRKKVDVFFQVATDEKGEDLSGTTIRDADTKSVSAIAAEMDKSVQLIKTRKDTSYAQVKRTMGLLPGLLAHAALTFTSFIMYTLNIWTKLIGSPRDPFGSVMITNIGSLGLDMAFAPLVPYSRCPLVIAMGAVRETAVARQGQVKVATMMRICATFDHRLIDGIHAAHMVRTIQAIFANPEKELGAV